MAKEEALAAFLTGLLAGTADIGITMIPLVAAYKKAKKDKDWRESGFVAWLTSDPDAAPLLERVLTRAKEHIPSDKRAALIIALGGIPAEE